MKRISSIMAVFAMAGLLMFSCGSTPEDKAVDVIKQNADITETFVNNLETANSAQDVAKAIDAYTADMKELIPRIQSLNEKYPEFKNGHVPKALEEEAQRLENLAAKMSAVMMKTVAYMMDPEVQKAMENMGKEMSKLGE